MHQEAAGERQADAKAGWHKLLERQLHRHYGGLDAVPEHLRSFLDTVSLTYAQADSDRRLVEHSLELASQELLQRNADLRAKQHEQQVIFDSVPALIIYKDTENRILRLNDAAARALGGTPATLEGKRTEEVLPAEVAKRLHDDDLEVIRSRRPKLGIVESHPGPKGALHWMVTDKVPFLDETGRVLGVIVFSVDITQRKDAEARLAQSEERYRLIVETATEGIWTLDEQGGTTFVNGIMADMLGYDRHELMGRNVFEFIPPEDAEGGREKLAAILQGTHVALDFRFRRKNGTDLWTQASGAPLRDNAGRVIGALGMLTDISKRKAAEADLATAYERLKVVDRERMQFLNNAAHELSTPLTPITLQMHMLRQSTQGTPAAHHADILGRNFDRLAHLVKDLLDAARLQAASLRLQRTEVDLRDLIAHAVDSYAPAAQQANVHVAVEAESVPVLADANRIAQVLENLVSNALKFTPAGGRIVIQLERRDGQACLAVRDSGIGIAADKLPRLFKPFMQVHDPMKITTGGTGLGLYVSQGIVSAHGGRLEAQSNGPDCGSQFTVWLPLDATTVGSSPPATS